MAAFGRAVLGGSIVLSCLRVYGRAKSASQFIPGWLYSFVAVLEPGATSWTGILDVVRLGPADDATAVTAAQLRAVVERLVAAGQWQPGAPDATETTNYGKAEARRGTGHPKLTHRSAWPEHDGELPVVEGTLDRLKVEHLSEEREAPPVWLWSSKTGAVAADVDRWWQGFLRRFDLEHTFRFAKQTLGWTTPKLRTPEAADRWTWLLVVAHTQLRLARPPAADLRRPWEKPAEPARLTPARVRRGFRNIRAHLLCPARVPQPRGAGPGRPPGAKNRRPAPRYDVGKTVKRPETIKAIGRPGR